LHHFGSVPVASVLHPIPDTPLHRNN